MNYYKEIKNLIEEKEVNDKVRYLESNKETIKTYYEIGRLLIKAQGGEEKAKYGDGLIKKWSEKLTKEYGNGYSEKNLKRMRKFYIYFKNEKRSTLLTQLSWSHWNYILSYDNKNYYVDLLLFNYKLIRYIVCELKLGEIKQKDVAQTKVYMMLTGKFLKRRFHNETIGIIITRKNGKLALEYVSDPNIFVTTYKLNGKIKMVNT